MLKRQKGQAFILVLILLMVGALLITPFLNLAWSGLKGRMAEHTDLMEYYAADGASDYSLWRLSYESGFAASLTPGVAAGPFYIILNGIKAEYSVTAQAAESAPSDEPVSTFTTDRYKITITVTPDFLPEKGVATEFTYTITLKYMYPDVPTQALTELRVTFPRKFTYETGSTTGFTTVTLTTPGSDFRWSFDPAISFNYWEGKTMGFQATTTFPAEGTYYHDVEARVGGVVKGSTTAAAPIVVVQPTAGTEIPKLKVTKTVSPTVIPPGENVTLTYTITLENLSSLESIDVQSIEDALPAGFSYLLGSSNGTVFTRYGEAGHSVPFDPTGTAADGRVLLEWKFTPSIGDLYVSPRETLTLSFQARGLVDSSGTYANEVYVKAPGAINEYSWPTGSVTVPQYDIESSAGDTTLRVNAQISGGSHVIKSWQVE